MKMVFLGNMQHEKINEFLAIYYRLAIFYNDSRILVFYFHISLSIKCASERNSCSLLLLFMLGDSYW
jgi:hypothetical protein